jgi:hypothetical protein
VGLSPSILTIRSDPRILVTLDGILAPRRVWLRKPRPKLDLPKWLGSPVRGIAPALEFGRSPDDAISMWEILGWAIFGWIVLSVALVAVSGRVRLGGSVYDHVTGGPPKARSVRWHVDESWLTTPHRSQRA